MKTTAEQDQIVKVVTLAAPISKVWRALTDFEQFGAWFQVDLDGPFVPGGESTGRMTYPGHEGTPWLAYVERITPERYFSFRWPSKEPDPGTSLSEQCNMLVEFELEPTDGGTRLTITESGFSQLEDADRLECFRRNTDGWNIQSENIARYVS